MLISNFFISKNFDISYFYYNNYSYNGWLSILIFKSLDFDYPAIA